MKWNEGNGKQDQVCDDSFVHVCVPFVGFSIACWGRAFKSFHHGDKKSTEILWWKSKRLLTTKYTKGKSFILNREVRKEREDSLNARRRAKDHSPRRIWNESMSC